MNIWIVKSKDVNETSVEIHCQEETEQVKRLKKHIEGYEERIQGKCDGQIMYVDTQDILYFESVDQTTFLYTKDKVLSTNYRLYELEKILEETTFFRCSKSVIVNVKKIVTLRPEITRNILATLCNEEVIVISRRYVAAFRKLIDKS
ncbi:MAG: LytTR family DNA-binding domain-containing protein [Eubacteriales bacterium]|nr:LytTR family DNA-binding domain-containing protein [Eubacteriales bacterium]